MSQRPHMAVPKFSSFKSKAQSKVQAETQEASPKNHDQERRHREKRRQHDESSRNREDHASHRHAPALKDRSTPNRQSETDQSEIREDEFEESSLFIIDRRGDAKNVEYGSLHRYAVPNYHRTG